MFRPIALASYATACLCFAATLRADEPASVDQLDFEALPIAAPERADVALVLHALEGRKPKPEEIEQAWRILNPECRRNMEDVIRLADARGFRSAVEAAWQKHFNRMATTAERIGLAAEFFPLADSRYYESRAHRFAKHRERRLEGTVVDSAGRPVEGAVVQNWTDRYFTTTDRNGAFAFEGVSPRDFNVLVSAAKEGIRGRVYPIRPEAADAPIRIRMATASTASFAVFDPRGKPLPNAAVVAGVSGPGVDNSGYYQWLTVGRTDRDGKAEVGRLIAGEKIDELRVRHRGFLPTSLESNNGAPLPSGVELRAGVTVSGAVSTPDGRPAAGAVVSWRNVVGKPRPIRRMADAQGEFSFVVEPGDGVLCAEHPDWALCTMKLKADPARAPEKLAVSLMEGAFIEGKVEQGGKPAEYCQVTVGFQSLPDWKRALPEMSAGNWTATDSKGEFRIGPLPREAKCIVSTVDPDTQRFCRSKVVEVGAKDVVIDLNVR